MGKFYGVKIQNGEINPKTGEAWKIEDVPRFFRAVVTAWLAGHAE